MKVGSNSFDTLDSLNVDGQEFHYFSLARLLLQTGSSRDWAAKGTRLLGVRAVIAESFERIHRSNLIGMGVLPLQFIDGFDRKRLNLSGAESLTISGMQGGLNPGQRLDLTVRDVNGSELFVEVLCRIDTRDEVAYYQAGGILQYVLDNG